MEGVLGKAPGGGGESDVILFQLKEFFKRTEKIFGKIMSAAGVITLPVVFVLQHEDMSLIPRTLLEKIPSCGHILTTPVIRSQGNESLRFPG